MKIISYSFIRGGAAIAAKKFVDIARETLKLNVETFSVKSGFSLHFLKRLISFFLVKLQRDHNPIKHSLNLFSYRPIVNILKKPTDDIFHFHWINNDTLSIFDFKKIPQGSIITLHDEWLYCGAEHYETDDSSSDFIRGYHLFKHGIIGVNWNFLIWNIKLKTLSKRNDLIYTVPSTWMLDRASQSLILKNADIRLLPNPINTQVFCPASDGEIFEFRRSMGLALKDILITFGAIGGSKNILKGIHYLEAALKVMEEKIPVSDLKRIKLVIFGGNREQPSQLYGFDTYRLGKINDNARLATLYSASNCVVVPSVIESFGQVAAEASSCGTPVVCFATSGLKDIVLDDKSGMLAKPFEVASLAEKLHAIIAMSFQEQKMMGYEGRQHIVNHFSYNVIARQYSEIINDSKKIKAMKN